MKIVILYMAPLPKLSKRQLLEIRKDLKNFVKREYSEKKPLKIRLIQVKPRVSFKKGTMLPNLIVKSLQNSAYLIIVDYGTEIRAYFHDLLGRSMGGSTIPKTQKVLNELKGMGKTIYRLPKPDPTKKIDTLTMSAREIYSKLLRAFENKHGLHLEKVLPLSIVEERSKEKGGLKSPSKKEVALLMKDPSFGINLVEKGNDFALHLSRYMYDPEILPIIIQKEILAQYLAENMSNYSWGAAAHAAAEKPGFITNLKLFHDSEILQVACLVWVLFDNSSRLFMKCLNLLKDLSLTRLLPAKFRDWTCKIASSLQGKKKFENYSRTLASYLFQSLTSSFTRDVGGIKFKNNPFWFGLSSFQSSLLVLMKDSISIMKSISQIPENQPELRQALIISLTFHDIYSRSPLLKLYGVKHECYWEIAELWIDYLIQDFILRFSGIKKMNASTSELTFSTENQSFVSLSRQKMLINLLLELKFKAFLSKLSQNVCSKEKVNHECPHQEFLSSESFNQVDLIPPFLMPSLKVLLIVALKNQVFSIRFPLSSQFKIGDIMNVSCKIRNFSDLEFHDFNLVLETLPKNRLDGDIELERAISSMKKELRFKTRLIGRTVGNVKIILKITCKDFLNPTGSLTLPLLKKSLEIIP